LITCDSSTKAFNHAGSGFLRVMIATSTAQFAVARASFTKQAYGKFFGTMRSVLARQFSAASQFAVEAGSLRLNALFRL
jgi:hypothetical protein